MIVGDLVRTEITRRFRDDDAAIVAHRLAVTELPFLDDPRRSRERDRVHLAILKLAEGRLAEFEDALEQAAIDWRDVLMAAGLGHADWPEVLRAAGYPVP